MERCQCLIRIVDIFLEIIMVSLKNLTRWGFNDVGPWFSAGMSDNCWSPLSRIMVLYLNLCLSQRDPLHVDHAAFSATTVYRVGDLEFPLFRHCCWCILWGDC